MHIYPHKTSGEVQDLETEYNEETTGELVHTREWGKAGPPDNREVLHKTKFSGAEGRVAAFLCNSKQQP